MCIRDSFKRESGEDVSKIKDIQQFVDEVSDTEIYDNAERMERIAAIAGYVDVISCNYQEQWYPMTVSYTHLCRRCFGKFWQPCRWISPETI